MSWAHDLAREFRGRDNKSSPAWFRGDVISPVRWWDEDHWEYEGPLIISCFDGQVMLREANLQMLAGIHAAAGIPRLYKGVQPVALLGNVFSGDPGSLKVLILGVVENAI